MDETVRLKFLLEQAIKTNQMLSVLDNISRQTPDLTYFLNNRSPNGVSSYEEKLAVQNNMVMKQKIDIANLVRGYKYLEEEYNKLKVQIKSSAFYDTVPRRIIQKPRGLIKSKPEICLGSDDSYMIVIVRYQDSR